MFHTGEIVWAHIRGFPWWPGRVINPTAAQLKRLSIERVPSDQRLIWFFNDNDRYKLINVKNIREFRDQQITLQTKSKTGKHAAQLKQAFGQASAEYRNPNDLDDDEPIDAVIITPSTTQRPRSSSANQSRKSKKRKTSDLTPSSHVEDLSSNQFHNSKTTQPIILTNQPPHTRPKPVRHPISHKNPQSAARASGDAESDRLSTHCNPSPCDRSSQETGVDSRSNLAPAKNTPPRSNLLRLRIRPKRLASHKEKQKDPSRPDSPLSKHGAIEKRARTNSSGRQLRKKEQRSSLGTREHGSQSANRPNDESSGGEDMHSRKDGTDLSRREKKRKVSDLPPKLRHGAMYNGGDAVKRRRLTISKRNVESLKPGLSEVRVLDSAMDISDSSSEGEYVKVSQAKKPESEPQPSAEVTRILESGRVGRSDAPPRRSRRRRVSSRMGGSEEDSDGESEDDAQRPVASKRSRGVEAPRMSDGQRRLHTRQVGSGKRIGDAESKGEKGKRVTPRAEHMDEDKISDSDLDETTKSYKDLSKDECIKVIYKMRETLRRKNVQLWLRGRKLVEARDVWRTEEGLMKACESGVEKAEKLVRWVKKHEGYEKGEGSRFAKLETKAIEECEVLVDVYFDRRRVSLKKIGPRILKLTKELAPHSTKVTEVLLDLLVLWLDLTSGSEKKTAGMKSK